MGRRILLVDDDCEIAEFLLLLLEMEGFELQVARRGFGVPELAAGVDLVLLDVTLPDVDGIELCSILRSDPRTRELPILVVSGIPADDVRNRALQAGANEFVGKPFENADLVARIRRWLQLR